MEVGIEVRVSPEFEVTQQPLLMALKFTTLNINSGRELLGVRMVNPKRIRLEFSGCLHSGIYTTVYWCTDQAVTVHV